MLHVVLVGAGVLFIPGVASAHGIGGRQDLPVPLEVFLVGAGVVVVATFVLLSVMWPDPRMQDPPRERILGWPWLRILGMLGGLVSVVLLVVGIVAGLVGSPNPTSNPLPVLVFVVFWLVIPFASAIVGNVYPALSPWRRIAQVFGLGTQERILHEERVGYWPGAIVFVAFTWLELVYPNNGDPRHLGIAALVYTAYVLVYTEAFGRDTVLETGDGFGVYSFLLGGMGPFGTTGGGDLVWRGWLRGLPHTPERPGLVAMVATMIGTVTFDGASATPWWRDTVVPLLDSILGDPLGLSLTWRRTLFGTVGLLLTVGAIWLLYLAAAAAAARVGGMTLFEVAGRFAHTLVPIAFAYAFAHYFTLVVFEGQLALSTLSDPFGRGWNLFGTAGRAVDYSLIAGSTAWVWYVQVAAIVGGHVAGVVLAHDRALADFPPATAVRSQYAMLVLMVVLTMLGLTILAAG